MWLSGWLKPTFVSVLVVSAAQNLPSGTIIQGQLVDLVWQGQTAPTKIGSGNEQIRNMPIKRIPSSQYITQVIPVATGLDPNGKASGIKEMEVPLIGVGPDGTITIGPRDGRFDITHNISTQMSRFELAYNAAQLARSSYESAPVAPEDIERLWPGVRVTAGVGTIFRASPDNDWLEIETSNQEVGAILELPKYRMLRDQLRIVHVTLSVPRQEENGSELDLRFGLWKGKETDLNDFVGFRRIGASNYVWHVAASGRPARTRAVNFGGDARRWRIRINSADRGGHYLGFAANTTVNNGVYYPHIDDNISDIVQNSDKRFPVFQLKSVGGKPVKVRLELMTAIRS
jgi:hypothetical protein